MKTLDTPSHSEAKQLLSGRSRTTIEKEIIAKTTRHSECRINPVPDVWSGHYGLRIACNDCSAFIERQGCYNFDVGSNPSYEDPKVREVLERMAIIPCVTNHRSKLRPIPGRLTGKHRCVQVICNDCGASVIRVLTGEDYWASYESSAVREALARIMKVPCTKMKREAA